MRQLKSVSPEGIDFGETAKDYAMHRAGFPAVLYDLLKEKGIGFPGQRLADLGTGTGTLARGFAHQGLDVTGLDPAAKILDEAKLLAEQEELNVTFVQGMSENTKLAGGNFDIVTAGQCWHWFDAPKVTKECLRLLKPGGFLVICHFDWLPLPGNVVDATEQLILKHNPSWAMSGGTGLYPQWLVDMSCGGFTSIETFSKDLAVSYSHEAWRGRIRASAGVSASLNPEEVESFDLEHKRLLEELFPEDPLQIPHRLWAAIARKPLV